MRVVNVGQLQHRALVDTVLMVLNNASVTLECCCTQYAMEKYKDLTMVPYPECVPDDWADFVYSNSVIEHIESPLQEPRVIHRKVKKVIA